MTPVQLGELPIAGKVLVVRLNQVVEVVVERVDIDNIEMVAGNQLVITVVSLASVLSLRLALRPSGDEVLWPIHPGNESKDLAWALGAKLDNEGNPVVLWGKDSLLLVVVWNLDLAPVLRLPTVWSDADKVSNAEANIILCCTLNDFSAQV